MTEILEIYKCELCGNMVEMIHTGAGELVCCGQPMKLLEENSVDAAHEKHVPIIEKTEDGIRIKVGEVAHPMEDKHYIEWIELVAGGKAYRRFLKPGDTPEAMFCIKSESISARAYCNIHGLWKN